MAKSYPQATQPAKVYSLRSVAGRVKEILLDVTTKRFWVKAHLVTKKGVSASGHFYCELVETDERVRQVAKVNAVI
jgi:hypothetical protein